MKRVIDFSLATLLLLLFSPIVLIMMVAIYWDSGRPMIFSQRRVGRNQKPFICYKLRTMAQNTRNLPSHENQAAVITGLGKWLRKLKFDELPQLFNVWRGEMSFVGPRPCLPSQTELIALRNRDKIFALRPGITGWAQIHNVDMSDPESLVQYDAVYLQTQSIGGDFRIMLATVLGRGLQVDAARAKTGSPQP